MVDKNSSDFLLGELTTEVRGMKEAQADAITGLHLRLDKFDKLIPQVAKNTTRITIQAWLWKTVGASFIGAVIIYIRNKISGS